MLSRAKNSIALLTRDFILDQELISHSYSGADGVKIFVLWEVKSKQ